MSDSKSEKTAVFSNPSELKWFDPLPGETVNVRVDSELNGYGFAIAEVIVQPMAGPPLHIHHDTDEVLYVVQGTVDFVCDGKHFRSGPGGLVVIPKGSRHAFRNFGDGPARLLGFLPTGGLEQLFKQMEGRPSEHIAVLAAQHHMEIVGPPIDEVSAKILERSCPSGTDNANAHARHVPNLRSA